MAKLNKTSVHASLIATISNSTRLNGPFAFHSKTTSVVAAGTVAAERLAKSNATSNGTPNRMSPKKTMTAVMITTAIEIDKNIINNFLQ